MGFPDMDPQAETAPELTADVTAGDVTAGDANAVDVTAPAEPEVTGAEATVSAESGSAESHSEDSVNEDAGNAETIAEDAAAGTQAASDGSGQSSPEGLSAEELLPGQPAAASAVELQDAKLKAVLEAIIYITDEPLSLEQISTAIEQPIERVAEILDQLTADYEDPARGLSIREVAGGYKMATKPEHHEEVRRFVKNLNPPLKLSLPALETLAVIAYKQPITAPEIMEIRGVQGAGVLKTLLDRKLIAAAGRKQVIGKPILYKTTREFLVQFGLKNLNELPTLKEFQEIGRMDTEGATDATSEDGTERPLLAEEPDAPREADLSVMPETPDESAAESSAEPAAPASESTPTEAVATEAASSEAAPDETTSTEAASPESAPGETTATEAAPGETTEAQSE